MIRTYNGTTDDIIINNEDELVYPLIIKMDQTSMMERLTGKETGMFVPRKEPSGRTNLSIKTSQLTPIPDGVIGLDWLSINVHNWNEQQEKIF
jgi:hypothetical protein